MHGTFAALALDSLRECASDYVFTQAHAKGLRACATTSRPIAFKLRAQRFSSFYTDAMFSSWSSNPGIEVVPVEFENPP